MKKKVKNYENYKIIILIVIAVFVGVISLITIVSSSKCSNLAFLSYRFYAMESAAHSDVALRGALVIAKKVDMDKLNIGDNVVYTDGKYNYVSKVTGLQQANNNNKIVVTDANGVKYRFSPNELGGVYVNKITFLGSIVLLFRTVMGIILFTMFCVCILFSLIILLPSKKEYSNYNCGNN